MPNVNQILILLGEYVVKYHLAESRAEALDSELTEARQTIEEQELRLANAHEILAQTQGGTDAATEERDTIRSFPATPR